jgi:hypothetical protein
MGLSAELHQPDYETNLKKKFCITDGVEIPEEIMNM